MARKKTPEFTWGPLSEKQLKVLTWWRKGSAFADYDGIIADGAIRSGKTVSMEFSYVEWAMETFDGHNFGICGKTIESLRAAASSLSYTGSYWMSAEPFAACIATINKMKALDVPAMFRKLGTQLTDGFREVLRT